MHGVAFLQDLALVMIVAGIVTILFHRFRQPVVLGYIIAGVIIGPHTGPVLALTDEESIRTLSELGVVFLMFSLGMEFSLKKLKKVGFTALIAAVLEILLMIWVGYEIGASFGWKQMDCLFLGAMLSISSTTIIVKALGELGRAKEAFAEIIFGILIVEDILAIVMIALLSGIAMTGSLEMREVVDTTMRLGIFLVVALVLGLLAVPRLISYVARFRSNEMLLITVLGLCFGVSLLAVKLKYSVALGAFVIGAVIAEARELKRIEHLMEPIRDMFSAVFFVAIGLLIDPALITKYWLPVVVISAAVIVGKVIACSFGAFVAGNDTRTSLRVGMGLAQIGEFSFIIAALGLSLRVTSEFLYPIAVTVSAITTLATPYLVKSSDPLVGWFGRTAPSRLLNYLNNYTVWVGQLRRGRSNLAAELIRRWAWQIALNVALVAGIFITVTYLVRQPPAWMPALPGGTAGAQALGWLTAAVLSLPLLIATYRKLQAFGLLLSEIAAPRFPPAHAQAGKVFLSSAISAAGAVSMGLLVLTLSSALLPSWKSLVVLGLIVLVVAAVMWKNFVRVYSKAQIALKETLTAEAVSEPEPAPIPLANLLKEARIETMRVEARSPVAGKLISELALRTRTGASIVAIERNGATLINPAPDEELRQGDHVLLLGRPAHLEAARADFAVARA
jgi:monovalent cation:H+ antiporter-2, CPA2 family